MCSQRGALTQQRQNGVGLLIQTMNGIIITANTPSRLPNHQSQCGCLTNAPACQSPDYFLSKVSRFTRPAPAPKTKRHDFESKQHDSESHSRKKSLKKRSPSRPHKKTPPKPRNPFEEYYPGNSIPTNSGHSVTQGVALGSLPLQAVPNRHNPSINMMDDATTMRESYQQGLPYSSRVYASSEPALSNKPRINFVTSNSLTRPLPMTVEVQEPMSARVIVSHRQSLETGRIYESLKNLNELKEEYMESSSSSDQNVHPSAKPPPQYDSLFFSQSQELKDSLFANVNKTSTDSHNLLSTRSAAHSGRISREKESYLLSSNILKGKAKKVEQAQRNSHLTNITDIEEICSQNDSESNEEIKESIVLSRLNNGRSQDKFFKNTLAMGKMTNANSTHTMPTMQGSVFTRKDTLEEKWGLRGTAI